MLQGSVCNRPTPSMLYIELKTRGEGLSPQVATHGISTSSIKVHLPVAQTRGHVSD